MLKDSTLAGINMGWLSTVQPNLRDVKCQHALVSCAPSLL